MVLLIWGILGLQLWGGEGALYSRCRLTPFPVRCTNASACNIR